MITEKSGDFFQWLRGFYFTAKLKGIRPASRRMGRSQSSVSYQIKCLEEDLGVQLFDRSKNQMKLTEEGFAILEYAIQVFESVTKMETISKFFNHDISGQIRIVTTHAILLNFLPKAVTNFRKQYPNVSLSLDSGNLDYITSQVSSADANFGIACPITIPEPLSFDPLFNTKPVLISPFNKKWDIPDAPTLKEIAHLPYISFPVGASIEMSIRRQFASKGLSYQSVLLLSHYEHVKSYVEMGLGVSILDDYTLTSYDYQRLKSHKILDFNEIRTYGVLTRKNGYLSHAVRLFLDSLRGSQVDIDSKMIAKKPDGLHRIL